jgi:hypothetical protein
VLNIYALLRENSRWNWFIKLSSYDSIVTLCHVTVAVLVNTEKNESIFFPFKLIFWKPVHFRRFPGRSAHTRSVFMKLITEHWKNDSKRKKHYYEKKFFQLVMWQDFSASSKDAITINSSNTALNELWVFIKWFSMSVVCKSDWFALLSLKTLCGQQ